MRGSDQRSGSLFSVYVDLESRVRLTIRCGLFARLLMRRCASCRRRSKSFTPRWAAVDPPGAIAAGAAAASVLHGALGTAVDGATRLQSVVPLVRRVVGGRCGVGCNRILQEPRPAARRRHRGQVHDQRAEPATSARAALQRALLGRRHADRGLGQHEEFLCPRMAASRHPGKAAADATPSATSMARNARTTRIPRPPTPMPGCSARAPARRPSSATWGIC